MKPFGLIADLHLHLWSQFSEISPDGMNSRLQGLLDEIYRCGVEVKAAGGDTIYVAGDVFHVRGSVSPLVQNPAFDLFTKLKNEGISVVIIPGNHDLAGKNTTRLGSAVTALEGTGAVVCNEAKVFESGDEKYVLVIPWYESLAELKSYITTLAATADPSPENIDLILHAPINGVIAGLPEHGLDPEWLASLGFRRVFAGHHHNHRDFENSVFSIGALAHHTFSDVNSKAGFLIVGDDVRWMQSHLPEFQDLDELIKLDADAIPLLVDGNFVRVKTEKSKHSELEEIKSELLSYGAKAVIINQVRKPEARRSGGVVSSVSAGASLGVSVSEYVKSKAFNHAERVEREAQHILAEAGI